MSNRFGYAGKILKVDLSRGDVDEIPTKDYAERFLGGRGIAVKLYWDYFVPEASAYDPENPLIFVNGPLAGFAGLAGSRWQVCGKSPATTPESFSYCNLGGSWGAWLKFAGFDAIVVLGKSDKPVYLFIHNNMVQIKEASFLQGKGAITSREILKDQLGKDVRIAAIGPAGECRAVMANIIADEDSSGSGGFGAVMGSKGLKAIAVKADERETMAADPEKLKKLVSQLRALRKDSRFIFSGPHRMWSSYVPEDLSLNKKLKKTACYGCISGCTRATYKADNGETGKYLCVAAVFYADPRKKPGEWDDTHFHASRVCNEYGLDVFSVLACIAWLQRCFMGKILSDETTGLPLSKMGSLEFIQTFAEKISNREGFGDLLAQGIAKAAESVGPKAVEQLANWFNFRTGTVFPYDPRVLMTNAIAFATEPRLPMAQLHETSLPAHLWWDWAHDVKGAYVSSDVVRSIGKKFQGSELAFDFSTYDAKASAAKRIQDRVYVKECLNLCDFAWPMLDVRHSPDHVGDPALPSKVLSAIIGKSISEQELYKVGERVFNLQRAILIREGRSGREDDSLPDFFYKVPLPKNPGMDSHSAVPGKDGEIFHRTGSVVDREKFEQMKDEYYLLRGWDPNTGLQRKDTLNRLGLADLIAPLKDKVL